MAVPDIKMPLPGPKAAALIARDELKDGRRALNHLYGALDDDSTLDRAREAMESIALTVDDPRELVRVYQRKIKALGPDANDTPKLRAERAIASETAPMPPSGYPQLPSWPSPTSPIEWCAIT